MFLQLLPWVCSVWQPTGGSTWGFPLLLLVLICSSHPWEWHRNMAGSGKEPVAAHGAQWWIQLSTRKAKWSPDYFWNHGSSQLRALFGTGCPLWNIPYSGMSNHGIHPPPHTELSYSVLTRLWTSSLAIPVSHGSLQWDQVSKATKQGKFFKNRQTYLTPEDVPCVFLPVYCKASA